MTSYISPWRKLRAFWPQIALLFASVAMIEAAALFSSVLVRVPTIIGATVSGLLMAITALNKSHALTPPADITWDQLAPPRAPRQPRGCMACRHKDAELSLLRETVLALDIGDSA